MIRPALLATVLLLAAGATPAQDNVLNLYSARHYQTDEALYDNFTKATGIKINRLDGKEDELVERIERVARTAPQEAAASGGSKMPRIARRL